MKAPKDAAEAYSISGRECKINGRKAKLCAWVSPYWRVLFDNGDFRLAFTKDITPLDAPVSEYPYAPGVLHRVTDELRQWMVNADRVNYWGRYISKDGRDVTGKGLDEVYWYVWAPIPQEKPKTAKDRVLDAAKLYLSLADSGDAGQILTKDEQAQLKADIAELEKGGSDGN